MSPRIGRYAAALEIGAVPDRHVGRALREGIKSLRAGGVTPGVEVEQVERRAEALDLQPRRLHARFAEIAQHARPDETEQQADDRQHHQDLDQSVTGAGRRAEASNIRGRRRMQGAGHSASSVMLRSALMMEMMRRSEEHTSELQSLRHL